MVALSPASDLVCADGVGLFFAVEGWTLAMSALRIFPSGKDPVGVETIAAHLFANAAAAGEGKSQECHGRRLFVQPRRAVGSSVDVLAELIDASLINVICFTSIKLKLMPRFA